MKLNPLSIDDSETATSTQARLVKDLCVQARLVCSVGRTAAPPPAPRAADGASQERSLLQRRRQQRTTRPRLRRVEASGGVAIEAQFAGFSRPGANVGAEPFGSRHSKIRIR